MSRAAMQTGLCATVLVVEDEFLIRLSIAEHLRACAWHVLEAGTGDEARRLFLAGSPIDVVFSDVQTPGEMNGIALMHWLRDNHPEVHVMLTSGVAAMADVPAELCARASIFSKPYEHKAVAARIRALLE